MSPRILAAAALAAGLALSACGKMGALERPGPLFGGRGAPAAAAGGETTPRPVDTVDRRDRDPDTDLAPIRDAPIRGSGQDPFGKGPSGALPDPATAPAK